MASRLLSRPVVGHVETECRAGSASAGRLSRAFRACGWRGGGGVAAEWRWNATFSVVGRRTWGLPSARPALGGARRDGHSEVFWRNMKVTLSTDALTKVR